jgi:AraC-like DNA-binding protein
MAERVTGVVYAFETHILFVGALVATARHKHHAGQVMWVPGGVDVEGEDGIRRHAATHVVRPDRLHSHGAAAMAAVLWVDRDDLQWELSPKVPRDVDREFPATVAERPGDALAPQDARDLAWALLNLVAQAHDRRACAPRHPAVRRMCALLEGMASEREISVTELARQSGLSMRQLRHRFTEELGINPRAYLRWRRLRRAMASIERGDTLTQAALESGFADSAHFSRVFRAHFGMAPSRAISSVRFVGSLT